MSTPKKSFDQQIDDGAELALKTLKRIVRSKPDEEARDFAKREANQVEACKLLLTMKMKNPASVSDGDLQDLYASFKVEYKTTAKRLAEDPLVKLLDRGQQLEAARIERVQ